MTHEQLNAQASMKLARTADQMSRLAPVVAITAMADEPKKAASYLTGHLANIVGPLPEDLWQQMLMEAPEPCGDPGCNCHVFSGAMMRAADLVRRDWLREMVKNNQAVPPAER